VLVSFSLDLTVLKRDYRGLLGCLVIIILLESCITVRMGVIGLRVHLINTMSQTDKTQSKETTDKHYYHLNPLNHFADIDSKDNIIDKINELNNQGYMSVDVREKTNTSAFPVNTRRHGGGFKNVESFEDLLNVLHDDIRGEQITFKIEENAVIAEYETRGCEWVETRFKSPDNRLNEMQRKQAVEELQKEFKSIDKVSSVDYEQPLVKWEKNVDYETVKYDIVVTHRESYSDTKIPYHLNKVLNPVRGVLNKFEELCIDEIEYVETPNKKTGKLSRGYTSATIRVKLSMQ